MDGRSRFRKYLWRGGVAVALGVTATTVFTDRASAFEVILNGTADRDCGADADWTASATASSFDYGSEWATSFQVDGGTFGPESERRATSESFTYDLGRLDASRSSVTVTVAATWFFGTGTVGGTSTVTLTRPEATTCPGPTPTTSTTTSSTTTSTTSTTTSTTSTTTSTTEPPVEVEPIVPTAAYDCDEGKIVIEDAEDTDGVDYTVVIDPEPAGEGSPWAVTITAAPKPGFVFPTGTVTEWEASGTVTCNIRTPAKPSIEYDCDLEDFVGADDTDDIDYTVKVDVAPDGYGSTWQITVTAAPQPRIEFPPNATTEWTFSGLTDCTLHLPVTGFENPPTSSPVVFDCGSGQLVITGADDTNEIDFTETVNREPAGEGSVWDVTITAAPRPGFEFEPGVTTVWNYTGTVECSGSIANSPAAIPDAGSGRVRFDCAVDRLVIPGADDTRQIDYTVRIKTEPAGEDTPWDVTVTVRARPGFRIAEGATTEWNYSGVVDCVPGVRVAQEPPVQGIAAPEQALADSGGEHLVMALIAAALVLLGAAAMRLARRDESVPPAAA
jgi:hypothetical protein